MKTENFDQESKSGRKNPMLVFTIDEIELIEKEAFDWDQFVQFDDEIACKKQNRKSLCLISRRSFLTSGPSGLGKTAFVDEKFMQLIGKLSYVDGKEITDDDA